MVATDTRTNPTVMGSREQIAARLGAARSRLQLHLAAHPIRTETPDEAAARRALEDVVRIRAEDLATHDAEYGPRYRADIDG